MIGPFPDNLRFDLAGHGVKAEVAAGGEVGLALNLELQGTRHAFARDQINVQTLGIGTLVTVEVEREPESHRIDFSLLLPSVGLDLGHSTQHLTVLAVQTTHDDTRFPPVRVVQSYQPFELAGTATLVWSAQTSEFGDLFDLRVQGIFTFPRAGYAVELRRAEQQGKNPQERRLELTVREPPGPTPERPTTVKAHYLERTCDLYKTVTVLLEGPFLPPGPCSDFKATQVLTSTPNVFELNAEATCEISPAAELRRAEEQGSNPDDLWLRIHEPRESTGEPPKTVTVRYSEQVRVPYATVVFLPAGPCIHLAPGSQEIPTTAPPNP
jgi:hypothetical protein